MKTLRSASLLSAVLIGGPTSSALAAITGVAGGDGAPPNLLGPIPVVAFPADGQPLDIEVSSVASPLGGTVDFSVPLFHTEVGVGWGSWSHGYTGDVYYDLAGGGDVTLTLPVGTTAFYLYAEPAEIQLFEISAEAQNGTSFVQLVDGDGGASLFGFYATGGDHIASITMSSSAPFAIGEFGIGTRAAVPEGSVWAAVWLPGIVGIFGWCRRRIRA